MKERSDKILNQLMKMIGTNDIFWANEVRANMLVAMVMLACAGLLVLTWILNYVGVFRIGIDTFNWIIAWGILELLVPFGLCTYFKGQKKWLKVAMLVELSIVFARLYSVLSYRVILIMVIPVVLSVRYYQRGFTALIAGVSTFVSFLASIASIYTGILNINNVELEAGTQITALGGLLHSTIRAAGYDVSAYRMNEMVNTFLPCFMVFVIISLICAEIAQRGHELILKQEELTSQSARISAELIMATDIQSNMVPNIFPAFPERRDFDLHASMKPAKEVGGDFYDFFMVDQEHLAIVIGDVSGKGIPAALMMVVAKTLIKNVMLDNNEVDKVFNKVNNSLCDGNEVGLFVTAWLALINLKTGHVNFVNAGHNKPIIGHDGKYEVVDQKHGFILAGMEDVQYQRQELILDKNDVLFIYTDGITEANNESKEMYTLTRLLDALNQSQSETMKDLCEDVKVDIRKFVGKAEQFDDITMLAIRYKGVIL